jgi:hypothetical protein
MRALSFAALIVGVILVPMALGLAKFDHDHEVSELERALVAETDEHGGALESYFARARSIILLTANSPAFANVLASRGHTSARLSGAAVPDEHRRGMLHRRQWRGICPRGPRRDRTGRRPLHRGREGAVLCADLRAELRAGPPDPPVRLARHKGVGRRERDAHPAGRRPQARVRSFRGDGGEFPPRNGGEQAVEARQ